MKGTQQGLAMTESEQVKQAETTVTVALPADLTAALDRFSRLDGANLPRDEALLRAFRAWALENGFLHPEDDGRNAKRPEDLNAANDD